MRIPQIQDPDFNPACKPAVGDTVRGVGGIIIAFDPIATGFDAFIQLSGGGPWSGIDVFFHGVNPTAPPYNYAIGDSIVVEWMRTGEFQNATQVLAPNNNFTAPNGIVRKVSSGNPIPPFFVGTTTQLNERPTNTSAEQYEGGLVRIEGPLMVARTSLTGGLGQNNAFLIVDPSAPGDSVLVDGNKLTTYPPPVVGTSVLSVQGVFHQATRGYRIMLRNSADIVQGPFHSIATQSTFGGSVLQTPHGSTFLKGTQITLQAQPDPGFYFVGWGGDLAGSENPTTFPLDSDMVIQANFDSTGFIVEATVVGRGEVGRSSYRAQYPPGSLLTLTALPDPGHRFVGWSGDTTETAPSLALTVTRVLNFVATFEVDPAMAPSGLAVEDIPLDEGGKVQLTWTASPLDFGQVEPVLRCYRLDRRPASTPEASWDSIGVRDAVGQLSYSQLSFTPADSTAASDARHTYRVVGIAHTDPSRWISLSAEASSVDNLPPAAPSSVTGSIASGIATFFWPAVSTPDLQEYRIYRALDAAAPPTPATRVGTTTSTGFTDQPGFFAYYRVTSADIHGNESSGTIMTPVNSVDVEATPAPARLTLDVLGSSPSRGEVLLRLGAPKLAMILVQVLDMQGRFIRQLKDGIASPGWHDVRWDGRDSNGSAVPSGIYFLRALSKDESRTRRVTLIR